jgi:hypothetical protein
MDEIHSRFRKIMLGVPRCALHDETGPKFGSEGRSRKLRARLRNIGYVF